jgi:hypothetical protein
MRGKRGGSAIGYLLTIAVLSAGPLAPARAIDRSDARVLEVERDLRSVRSRVERAPRASAFELENLQRRLHDLRIDAPRDPRVQTLQTELRRLRAKAERNADRPQTAMHPRSLPLAAPAPIAKARYLGGRTPAAATPARSYLGGRLVALQRMLAAAERGLELGDTAAAARLLEAARGELGTLQRVFDKAVAEDPHLSALENRVRGLEERLAPP